MPRRHFKQQRLPLYLLLCMFAWPWLLKLGYVENTSTALHGFIALVYLNYFSYVLSIAKGLRLRHGIEPEQAVWLFILSNLLLIYTFATGWQMFDVYGTSAGCSNNPDFLDSLYFSATIFATVGFGDFLPCNRDGKLLFIAESFIGSTHFGIFITLIFSRVVAQPAAPAEPPARH